MTLKAPVDPTPELSLDDIYLCLCMHDTRYTYWADLHEDEGDDEEPRLKSDCCGNCSSGRDRLALEIIRLRDAR